MINVNNNIAEMVCYCYRRSTTSLFLGKINTNTKNKQKKNQLYLSSWGTTLDRLQYVISKHHLIAIQNIIVNHKSKH